MALERELSRAWRVNQKIASMFLSMVTNPDLSRGVAPWTRGIDWTYYVVVDSNVDLFLGGRTEGGGVPAFEAQASDIIRTSDSQGGLAGAHGYILE